jgi:hypothetical protein
MGIKIIDLVRHENEDRTVSFDTILFEDTEKDRWLLATVDSIDFKRFCQAFEVDSLRRGRLRRSIRSRGQEVRDVGRFARSAVYGSKIKGTKRVYKASELTH